MIGSSIGDIIRSLCCCTQHTGYLHSGDTVMSTTSDVTAPIYRSGAGDAV